MNNSNNKFSNVDKIHFQKGIGTEKKNILIDVYKVKKLVNKHILRKNLDQDDLTGKFPSNI